MKTIEDVIRKHLEDKDMSQSDLCRALRDLGLPVNRSTVSRWLSGQKVPTRDNWAGICKALGLKGRKMSAACRVYAGIVEPEPEPEVDHAEE